MTQKDLEALVFKGFNEGKTINKIAKECKPLIAKIPDYNKRVQKVDNLKKKWKKMNAPTEAKLQKVKVEMKTRNGGVVILKGKHKVKDLQGNEDNVIEVDINLRSEGGRLLYLEILNNARKRGDYRDFMHGMVEGKKESLKAIFSNLVEEIARLSDLSNNDSGIEHLQMLKSAIGNFTSFFQVLKRPGWISAFSSETLVLRNTIAAEAQGVQNGIVTKELKESENDEGVSLLDISKINFEGVL